MDANFGGTEILNAMRNVLSSRRSDIATAIFLLTDGEVRKFVSCPQIHNMLMVPYYFRLIKSMIRQDSSRARPIVHRRLPPFMFTY